MGAGGGDPDLRVGCAMWANRDWVGRYFPNNTAPGRELGPYATWCNAVEGNTTFYGLPDPATVQRWAEDAPAGFRFLFKLPRVITHDRRLRSAGPDLDAFLQRIGPLGPRASPCSIQLPASFGPGDLEVLERFLAGLPTDRRWGVEVRHPGLADGGDDERRLNEMLARHGAERILIDTRAVLAGPRRTAAEDEAHQRKPRLPVRPWALGPEPVVRFVGQTDPEANTDWWSKWVPRVARWLDEGRSPIVFIHTPDNLFAPELARRFHHEVADLRPDLTPLPEPCTPDVQLRLI